MAAPAAAAPVAGVYVAGAALFTGAAWLMTPAGQRASQSFGEAMYEGGATAVDNITSLFESDEEQTQTTPTTTTTTNTTTRECDGPHRGVIQVQGYMPVVDPFDLNPLRIGWGWTRPCTPPLRAEGLASLSGLVPATVARASYRSAGLRGPAFAKMSQHIVNSPAMGFLSGHRVGWNHLGRRAFGSGRNVPRVDLQVEQGRAFGDY